MIDEEVKYSANAEAINMLLEMYHNGPGGRVYITAIGYTVVNFLNSFIHSNPQADDEQISNAVIGVVRSMSRTVNA